jgi:serine/threonine protein kinase
LFADSRVTVSDYNQAGVAEYRAHELFDLDFETHFSKKTDVYAVGIILEKMCLNLPTLSHELQEVIKAATDS